MGWFFVGLWYYTSMEDKALIAKREAIRSAFDEQTKIISDAQSEQLRLQGEFRLVNELIDSLPKEESKDGKKSK